MWILLIMTMRSKVQKIFVFESKKRIPTKNKKRSRIQGDVGQCIGLWEWKIKKNQEGDDQN